MQLCYLRYPGQAIETETVPPAELLDFVARQLGVPAVAWEEYAQREETRRSTRAELQAAFGYHPFTIQEYRRRRAFLTELALRTSKGIAVAEELVAALRDDRVIVPSARVIDRCCAEALARGTRLFYQRLTGDLTPVQRQQLDRLLLPREEMRMLLLTWLRQPPGEPTARHVLTHLDRLQALRDVGLPADLARTVHQTRLTQLAREGAQMSTQHLRDLEDTRRYATLVALVLDTQATVIDQVLDLHDKIVGKLFADAKRKHTAAFAAQGKAINEKVRHYSSVGQAVIHAREHGMDPYAAIETVLPWPRFTQSVAEAAQLARPEAFDALQLLSDGYGLVHRYAPRLLESLTFTAVPAAQPVLDACAALRRQYASGARTVPDDAPTTFIKPRWEPYVLPDGDIDRRFYELCALIELKNALRAGDVWVEGSRQFKAFEEYLLPQPSFLGLREAGELALAAGTEGARYLEDRLALLEERLREVDRLAALGELPGVTLTEELLQVKPLTKSVPAAAEQLEQELYGIMPHAKITELLLEIDRWTDFTRHFTDLRTDAPARDRALLLTVLLADGLNLGLTKMAESCPGATFRKLDTLRAWHVRDETYAKGLAELVNRQHREPFAAYWGKGTTSSSDGQRYQVSGHGEHTGHVNLRYGTEPGVTIYTHISDRYAPFHSKVITGAVRDATHVLDGLLYHESELRIEEHYTDTNGFTDHVFALCPFLGFRFAPRIRDLPEKNLYVPRAAERLPGAGLCDRREAQHQAHRGPVAGNPAPGGVHQARHGYRLSHSGQAGQLSAPEQPGPGPAGIGPA